MGCFLGCFGDAKDRKNRKQRIRRAVPQVRVQALGLRNKVQNDGQQSISFADQSISETQPTDLVSQLLNKPEEEETLSPSPKKRVTFNSNITTYEHVSVFESTDSLPDCNVNIQREKEEDPKRLKQEHSESEDDNSATSSVGSYPSNHRYHNARDSDGEDEYSDSDMDDLDDLEDEDDCDDYDEDNIDSAMIDQEVWSESILIASTESRTENHSAGLINVEVESPMVKTRLHNEVKAFESKTHARDRSDYVNSVLNPVENTTQWKAAKSKGMHSLKKQKENLICNDAPHIPFSPEPTMYNQSSFSLQTKSDQLKKSNQEIAVDASLSNWLVSPPSKKISSSGLESITSGKTESKGSTSVRSFDDRPILGALTIDELKQISVSSSPKKWSPIRSPDEPIIGSVGSYWNHSNNSAKNFDSTSSYKGTSNTANNKYREDNRVNWQSTPFETRLERALNQGSAEA